MQTLDLTRSGGELPQHPIPPQPLPPVKPVPSALGAVSYRDNCDAGFFERAFADKHGVLDKGMDRTGFLIPVGAPQTWHGSFDSVRDQVQARIAELDAGPNRVRLDPHDKYSHSPNVVVTYEGDYYGSTPVQLIRATDRADEWTVTPVSFQVADNRHVDDHRIAQIDVDPQSGTGIFAFRQRYEIAGLDASARALVDAHRAIEILDGAAAWETSGRKLRGGEFYVRDPNAPRESGML